MDADVLSWPLVGRLPLDRERLLSRSSTSVVVPLIFFLRVNALRNELRICGGKRERWWLVKCGTSYLKHCFTINTNVSGRNIFTQICFLINMVTPLNFLCCKISLVIHALSSIKLTFISFKHL